MERNVKVVDAVSGSKIVVIQDIRFKGKQAIKWPEVEKYLKQYVGEAHIIRSTNDMVYIGAELPDEYTHSNYTYMLKGTNAKAKANAAQGLPELIMIADQKEYKINRKEKHSEDAKYGWYSYVTRFALPVYGENGDIERYNIFQAIILVRHAKDGKLYLYDIIKIKKETSNLFQPEGFTQ